MSGPCFPQEKFIKRNHPGNPWEGCVPLEIGSDGSVRLNHSGEWRVVLPAEGKGVFIVPEELVGQGSAGDGHVAAGAEMELKPSSVSEAPRFDAVHHSFLRSSFLGRVLFADCGKFGNVADFVASRIAQDTLPGAVASAAKRGALWLNGRFRFMALTPSTRRMIFRPVFFEQLAAHGAFRFSLDGPWAADKWLQASLLGIEHYGYPPEEITPWMENTFGAGPENLYLFGFLASYGAYALSQTAVQHYGANLLLRNLDRFPFWRQESSSLAGRIFISPMERPRFLFWGDGWPIPPSRGQLAVKMAAINGGTYIGWTLFDIAKALLNSDVEQRGIGGLWERAWEAASRYGPAGDMGPTLMLFTNAGHIGGNLGAVASDFFTRQRAEAIGRAAGDLLQRPVILYGLKLMEDTRPVVKTLQGSARAYLGDQARAHLEELKAALEQELDRQASTLKINAQRVALDFRGEFERRRGEGHFRVPQDVPGKANGDVALVLQKLRGRVAWLSDQVEGISKARSAFSAEGRTKGALERARVAASFAEELLPRIPKESAALGAEIAELETRLKEFVQGLEGYLAYLEGPRNHGKWVARIREAVLLVDEGIQAVAGLREEMRGVAEKGIMADEVVRRAQRASRAALATARRLREIGSQPVIRNMVEGVEGAAAAQTVPGLVAGKMERHAAAMREELRLLARQPGSAAKMLKAKAAEVVGPAVLGEVRGVEREIGNGGGGALPGREWEALRGNLRRMEDAVSALRLASPHELAEAGSRAGRAAREAAASVRTCALSEVALSGGMPAELRFDTRLGAAAQALEAAGGEMESAAAIVGRAGDIKAPLRLRVGQTPAYQRALSRSAPYTARAAAFLRGAGHFLAGKKWIIFDIAGNVGAIWMVSQTLEPAIYGLQHSYYLSNIADGVPEVDLPALPRPPNGWGPGQGKPPPVGEIRFQSPLVGEGKDGRKR